MNAIRIREYGDESVLSLDNIDRPTPESNELLIEIHAAAVNPFDTYVREGIVEPDGGLPHVLGGDASGIVAETGADVTAFEEGDRVFTTGLGLDRPGTYAEYVTVPEDRAASLPESVDFEAAAAAAETVTTGLQALERGDLSLGDVCLVQGATGGVGHATVQLASAAGAFVVGSCSEASTDAARGFGADAVVDYRATDLAEEVRAATGGRPVDVIVETHAATNVDADIEVLSKGGSVVVLGEDDDITIGLPMAGTAKAKQIDVSFLSHMRSTDHHGEALETAARLLSDGDVTAEVATTYPLEDAAAAQRHALQSGVVGKTVLTVRD